MNQNDFTLIDAPAQRVITDVIIKLRSLTDENDVRIFGDHVLPTTQYSFAEGCEENLPAALVYFGEEANGYNTSNQFDEMYLFPFLEICFLLFIPNAEDGTYPDVQKMQLALHNKVIQNLRVPTDDLTIGIPYQKTVGGHELWEFNGPDSDSFRHVVTHKFDVKNKWIEDGHDIKGWFYLSSIRIQVQVNNYNANA